MKCLSIRTQLAMAVALVYVGAPSFASAPVGHGVAEDEMLTQSSPTRLRMSYALSIGRLAAGTAKGPLPDTHSADEDAHLIVAGQLQMALRLAIDTSTRPSNLAQLGTPSRAPTDRPAKPAQEPLTLAVPGRAETSPWGKGGPDRIVDDEFNRLLLRYVRLQMPALPMWQMPPPSAPVRPVQAPNGAMQQAPILLSPTAPERVSPPERPRAGSKAVRRSHGIGSPVGGRAWKLSDQAYKAYNRGDYAMALERVNAALHLQPEVVRLHQLRVYALQKLGRRDDAIRAAEEALARGIRSPELEAAVKNLEPAPAGAVQIVTTPQYRKAFPIATLAYEQLASGKFVMAASNAEIAVRTDPTQAAWSLLWLNALAQQQKYEEAIIAGQQSLDLGAPDRDAIKAAMRLARQAIGVDHARQAYEALGKNRLKEAVVQAREAVRRAPDIASHRLLLISALQANQELASAEQAASDALASDDENTTIQLQRAYLRQQLGQGDKAQQDIAAVLTQDWIDEPQRRNARLIGADLALADGHSERALALLEPLPEQDAQAQQRRKVAESITSLWATAEPLPATAYAPLQLCRETPYGTVCEMQPWDAPGTDNPAARAYAAYAQKRYAEAIELARKAIAADPASASNESLLTTTLAAGTTAQQQEAMTRLDVALAKDPLDANLLRQRAYLRLANNQPALALQDFVAARSTGDAPPTNVLDEAYALAAMGNRETAAAILRQAIDDADQGKLKLDRQQRFDTRSAIASFSREWGVTASVGYRGARAPSNGLVGQPLSVPGNAAFSTVEAYWRPAEFLNSSTSTFDVYGRLSNTLYSGTNVTSAQRVADPCGGTLDVVEARSKGVAGLPTTTGALGVRYTPWTQTNLTFGLERQFLIGSSSRSGTLNPASDAVRCSINQKAGAVDYRTNAAAGAWQAYVLYGFYEGTGLRLDTQSWFTMEGYFQAGYTLLDAPTAFTFRDSAGRVLAKSDGKLKQGQAFAATEVRIGRSFLTDYSDRLVVFPHVSLAADWYSNRNRSAGTPVPDNSNFSLAGSLSDWSAGAGVGVNVRYWLSGDRYNAQRSYVDGSLQYRTRLGGVADRAKGLFLSLSYSY